MDLEVVGRHALFDDDDTSTSFVNPLRSHLNELPLIDLSSIHTKLREFRFSHFNVTLKHIMYQTPNFTKWKRF
ncbi:unnamed protein product [Prunus armeniaca]|uniref:Uncharacterized protein n=1 Tax=Prunus armeniaca TaxID=36596 RepID=A0A6J5TBS8_PRUAR|nr:unnamed protein product [Prunus armeniaca]